MMTRIPGDGYEIVIVTGSEPMDPDCDNVDVVVEFEGGRHHAAVFATLASIKERMTYFRRSGECASGLYFWASDLILIDRLTEDAIARTVSDLVASGDFESAFSGPSFDIEPTPRAD
ncbi:hypothetical protein V3331_18205 [Gaopeijia maritima]|uniref:hypothetical protein n=1 Tax=Gaopeijia maritima TaxID=3119007 RepID=UPI0032439AEA